LDEEEVREKARERNALKECPKIDGHLPLKTSARQLRRSTIRVREVAREVFGESLPTFAAKNSNGSVCRKTYVPLALQEKLRTYFAEAPAKQRDGLRRAWEARRSPAKTTPSEAGPPEDLGRTRLPGDAAPEVGQRPSAGRPKQALTTEIEDFCRNQMAAGQGSKTVAREVRERFARPRFTPSMARAYAHRARSRPIKSQQNSG
jgi:hypothetical protein